MVSVLFKWFLLSGLLLMQPEKPTHISLFSHPFFVTVTEIEHNAKDKTLEISCKIFTDDFEKTLRQNYKTKVDLTDKKYNTAMGATVNDYLQKHLAIKVDKKEVVLQFVGFEQKEESVIGYFQVDNITTVKKMEITNSILYDYQKNQMNIIHVTVNGKRQSNKLSYPDEKLVVEF